MIVTFSMLPASAHDMNSLKVTVRSCCWNFVEKFQISTPTTTSTTQNNKLFNVEFNLASQTLKSQD